MFYKYINFCSDNITLVRGCMQTCTPLPDSCFKVQCKITYNLAVIHSWTLLLVFVTNNIVPAEHWCREDSFHETSN